MSELEKAIRIVDEISNYEVSSWSEERKVGFKYALAMARMNLRLELESKWIEEDEYWNQKAKEEEAKSTNQQNQ